MRKPTPPNARQKTLRFYGIKSGSHQGEPCKQGWTESATGCTPVGNESSLPTAKAEQSKSKVNLPEEGTIRKRLIIPIGSNRGIPQNLLDQAEALDLSKDQKLAIQEYATEDSSSPTGYYQLNKAARQCSDTLDCLSSEQRQRFEELDALASLKMKEPNLVYRGLNQESGPAFMKLLGDKVGGKVVQLPGIVSTSVCPFVASNFGTVVVLEIKANTGLFIDSFRNGGAEREVIKSPNQSYKVISIQSRQTIQMGRSAGDGDRIVTIIQLEEI